MAEVEAEIIGLHQRALLRDVGAEHIAQRGVQQMCRGVVGADLGAARAVDLEISLVARCNLTALQAADMHVQAGVLLRVVDDELAAIVELDDTLVAGLAAALAVERRAVEHERRLRRRGQRAG